MTAHVFTQLPAKKQNLFYFADFVFAGAECKSET